MQNKSFIGLHEPVTGLPNDCNNDHLKVKIHFPFFVKILPTHFVRYILFFGNMYQCESIIPKLKPNLQNKNLLQKMTGAGAHFEGFVGFRCTEKSNIYLERLMMCPGKR